MPTNFAEILNNCVESINSFLWGPYFLIALLCGTGLFFTIRLGFVQIFKFKMGLGELFGNFSLHGEAAGKAGMSSFQAVATAIAAQVGTGNLVGATTALIMGGPGAIFWMWCAAFLGMATNFAEICLAQIYRTKDDSGHTIGGPAFYISRGLKGKWAKFLAGFFAIAIIIALGFIGNMVQANSISDGFSGAFGIPQWLTGAFLAIVCAVIFIGGVKAIARVAEKIVPLMALLYIIVGVAIIALNFERIPEAISLIFKAAFDPSAAWGGATGASIAAAMRYGIARGLFSNEAGMGSTPHAHAAANVKHPVDQAVLGIMSVFVDTFIVLISPFLWCLLQMSSALKTVRQPLQASPWCKRPSRRTSLARLAAIALWRSAYFSLHLRPYLAGTTLLRSMCATFLAQKRSGRFKFW